MRTTMHRLGVITTAAIMAVGLAACSSGGGETTDDASGEWPRDVEHVAGTTEIPAQPQTIVSTSLTLTGTLLAIDAPVTASAATSPAEGLTDDQGFFIQWADVADERGVEALYPDLELDIEAVIAADPDLIVVSSSGADSTAEQYDELAEIAPTIVIDYSSQSWEDVAVELGAATGLEDQTQAAIDEFDAHVQAVADAITVPEGDTNAIVYNGTEEDTAFAKPAGSHGSLLEALGFTVVGAADDLDTSEQSREDFAFVSIENSVATLTAPTVFVISGDEQTAAELEDEELFANAPAVTDGRIVALGVDSFRIDFYSGTQIVDIIESAFSA